VPTIVKGVYDKYADRFDLEIISKDYCVQHLTISNHKIFYPFLSISEVKNRVLLYKILNLTLK